tara:strand:- start:5 stop:472 length:468 start_codon:yes stop_codon:yes gene_type:complete
MAHGSRGSRGKSHAPAKQKEEQSESAEMEIGDADGGMGVVGVALLPSCAQCRSDSLYFPKEEYDSGYALLEDSWEGESSGDSRDKAEQHQAAQGPGQRMSYSIYLSALRLLRGKHIASEKSVYISLDEVFATWGMGFESLTITLRYLAPFPFILP